MVLESTGFLSQGRAKLRVFHCKTAGKARYLALHWLENPVEFLILSILLRRVFLFLVPLQCDFEMWCLQPWSRCHGNHAYACITYERQPTFCILPVRILPSKVTNHPSVFVCVGGRAQYTAFWGLLGYWSGITWSFLDWTSVTRMIK